jgi:hypothetical protein
VADNGERKFQKTLEGIQYLIGDNTQLREELVEFARQAAEDRRRADEDRRRADEDRRRADERFETLMEKSDERFALALDQVKRTNRVAVEVARSIRRELREGHLRILEGQERTNRLLHSILKRLPPAPNGK